MRKGVCIFVVLAGLLGASAGAFAQNVYVCEQDGKKTFSQTPCGDNAKVQSVGDRTVVVAVDMPHEDIVYFCRVVLRAWDQAGVASQNATYSGGYGYPRYRSYGSSYDSHDRVKTYVLSHVANLEQLARDEPQIYQLVLSTANSSSFNGDSHSYQYAADRGASEVSCQQHFETQLQQTAQRRYDADQARSKQLMRRGS